MIDEGGISELTPAPSEAITHTQVPDCGTQRGDQWVDPSALYAEGGISGLTPAPRRVPKPLHTVWTLVP